MTTQSPNFSDYPLRVSDVAEMLGFHIQYVRFLAKKGRIPGVKVCGSWRFSESELKEHLISFENSPVAHIKQENVDDII